MADIAFLRDTLAFARRLHARAGPVSRVRLAGREQAMLLSAEGSEAVLLDRAGICSARGGWAPLLGRLFPGGLILRDGAEHHEHRRRLLPAFRREALAAHAAAMAPVIEHSVEAWCRQGTTEFHAAVKALTLRLAAERLLGLTSADEVRRIGGDFGDLVEASGAIWRLRWPGGTPWRRGLAARGRLERFLHARIPQRRAAGGPDLFSQLCRAAQAPGGAGDTAFTDAEVVDHLIFLWMAAHDTTTSALTTVADHLARQPAWQERLAAEPVAPPAGDTGLHAGVLREALRLHPPLPTIARRLTAPLQLHGHVLPAGMPVMVFPLFVHRDERWWSDPDTFDPLRFAPPRAEHRRHPFAFTPFGGGAHRCLGLHFAEAQVEAVLRALLARARFRHAPRHRGGWRHAPIGHPLHGLWLRWERPATHGAR